MRNVSLYLSSLDTGSKNRLKHYRSNLKRDYDKRNFDRKVHRLLLKYAKKDFLPELKRTVRYLHNLRSSKDGKLFSQGVKEYSKLLKNAQAFAEPNYSWFGWNSNYKAALEEVKAEFSKLQLLPVEYQCDDDIRNNIPKMDTHAGFTYILSGVKEKGGNLENIYDKWRTELEIAIEDGSFGKPILPAVRTQGNGHAFYEDGSFTGDCDHKTRMVSMIDLMVIIAELVFAKPIQMYMASVPWYAGGKDLDTGVSRILTHMRTVYGHWVSLDYSAFDQSISAWLIHDAFDIIKSAFVTLNEEQEAIFKLIEHDFIEKDFILGDEIIHSVKGVPSGSMFTQIVDSIVNRLVITTYLKSISEKGEMIVMGDDNLVYTYKALNVEHLADYVRKNFGMTINASKTCNGNTFDHPTFLSCEWRPEGRYREPHVLISKMLYPERERTYEMGNCKEEEVVWSYVLAYRLGMRQFFNVEAFLADYPEFKLTALKDMGSHNLPGFLKYVTQYTYGFWSSGKKSA